MPTIVEIIYKGVNWEEKPCGSIILPPWMDGYENNMPEDVQKLKDAKGAYRGRPQDPSRTPVTR